MLAVVPLWRLRAFLPFAALAIGAMVPDLPLFCPIVSYAETHSPRGALTLCLPAGILFFLLFEFVMRRPLTALLPRWVDLRMPLDSQIPRKPAFRVQAIYFSGVTIAIVLGAWSHQVWDAFTHQGRRGTELLPFLNSEVEIAGYQIAGYKVIQYGSTFVGLPLLLLLAALRLCLTVPAIDRPASLPLSMKLLVLATILVIPLVVGTVVFTGELGNYQALGVTISRSGAVIFLVLVLYCGLFHVWSNKRRKSGQSIDAG